MDRCSLAVDTPQCLRHAIREQLDLVKPFLSRKTHCDGTKRILREDEPSGPALSTVLCS
jgi:hypothetical protein